MSVRALWCSGFINKSWLPLKRLLRIILYFAIFPQQKKSKSLVNAHAFGFHVKRKDNLNQYIRGILVIYSVSDVWTSNKHWG